MVQRRHLGEARCGEGNSILKSRTIKHGIAVEDRTTEVAEAFEGYVNRFQTLDEGSSTT
jgi:hypothetical protein